jgi:enoyl-CoA hydratase
MQMCVTGASVSAQQALAAGLVSKVVTREQLVAEALDIASSIARHSLPVLMAIKEAVGRSFESSLNEGLLFERPLFHASFALHDQKEGMAAFLQKRAPEFLNK